MIPLLIVVLALQEPAEPRLAPQAVLELGHLRHVQVLVPQGEVFRFATAALTVPPGESDVWPQKRATGSVIELHSISAGLERRVEVPFLLLHPFTWTTRPTWRVIELPGATWAACVDVLRGEPHVYDFDGGREVVPSRTASALYDLRLRDGAAELLVASGAQLELLVLRAGEADSLVATPLPTGFDALGAAVFARNVPDTKTTGTAAAHVWAVGWVNGDAMLVRAAPREAAPDTLRSALGTPIPGGSELRLAAASTGGETWLAVGEPSYNQSLGRVLIARAAGDKLRVEHIGRMDPESGGSCHCDQRDWGQALAFVPDADEDGVPDLVVTGPWAMQPAWWVDLVSTARWRRIARSSQTPVTWEVLGHWLDVSSDGTRILVGGADSRGMPEVLTYAGVLHVLEARTLTMVSSVRIAPQSRER